MLLTGFFKYCVLPLRASVQKECWERGKVYFPDCTLHKDSRVDEIEGVFIVTVVGNGGGVTGEAAGRRTEKKQKKPNRNRKRERFVWILTDRNMRK